MINDVRIPGSEACIQVENLWKIFGRKANQVLNSEKRNASRQTIQEETGCLVALRDISFSVNKGELFVIMGLSGSGKSTLIRCVLRLVEPTSGRILINGEDICRANDRGFQDLRRRTVSMVFQHYGLFPHRTVIDNVAYGLKVRGVGKEERYTRAREMIQKVGLQGWENHYPGSLSGGMQQRVGLARALANDPEILLMDEPFSGLDPLIRRQMQDELIAIQAELHKTVLFVTHDLDEALKLGSRIAIMKDGGIIQSGSPEDVITRPSSDYVREFVQDVSRAKVLTASSIMTQPEVVLFEWQELHEAIRILQKAEKTYGFLLGIGNKFRGLVTAKRLAALTKWSDGSIEKALEPDIRSATPDILVEDLLGLAIISPHPIPVVNEKGQLVGEISNELILSSMIKRRETEGEAPDVRVS